MLVLLSPAKSLEGKKASPVADYTIPDFLHESQKLITLLRKYTSENVQELMGISPKLAELNVQRFKDFKSPFTPQTAKQAIYTFNGDVYEGLAIETFDLQSVQFAQDHVRILSGLYGLLRPLDLMMPYRLEMGTLLANPRGKNLYQFWGTKLSEAVNDCVKEQLPKNQVVINLASQEYAKAIDTKTLTVPIIDVVFKDKLKGEYKIVGLHAKRARGMMTAFICKHQLNNVEFLKEFREEGYQFASQESDASKWVFLRG